MSITNPSLSLLIKHLVIGQRQKANFSAFHWSPHGILVSIGQHFVTLRLLKRTETSLITESDQAVRAVHSWLYFEMTFFRSWYMYFGVMGALWTLIASVEFYCFVILLP